MAVLGDKIRHVVDGVDLYQRPLSNGKVGTVFKRVLKNRTRTIELFCNFTPKLINGNRSMTVVKFNNCRGWYIVSTYAGAEVTDPTPYDTVEDAVAVAILTYERLS